MNFLWPTSITLKLNTQSNYFPGLNTLKGILTFLVIFTHSMPHGMILYINYLFHMPVYLAISGFLLKESSFKNGFKVMFKRLLHRLFIPWTLAWILYLPLRLDGRSIFEISISDLIYPFFHLWYIPAYFLGVLLCYAVTKYKIRVVFVLIITSLITSCWFVFYKESKLPIDEQPLYYLGDKRLYSYMFFFFIGFCLRNGLIKFKPSVLKLAFLIVIMFCLSIISVYQESPTVIALIPYMIFNTSLVLFLLNYIGHLEVFQNKFVLLFNKHSLGLYLFHPIMIYLIYYFLGDSKMKHANNWEGLIVGFTAMTMTLLFTLFLQKWPMTSRYFLGIIDNNQKDKSVVING